MLLTATWRVRWSDLPPSAGASRARSVKDEEQDQPAHPKECTMPDETSTEVFGAVTTRPPFDPELVPTEAMMRSFSAAPTIETLPALRAAISGRHDPRSRANRPDSGWPCPGRGAPGPWPRRRTGDHAADPPPGQRPRPRSRHLQHPRRRHDQRQPPDRDGAAPAVRRRRERCSGVGRVPPRTGAPRPRACRGLLRRAGMDGKARGRARYRPRPADHPRRQCRWWPRRGDRAPRPRPGVPGAQPPGPPLPDARRPLRDPQQPDARRRRGLGP